MVESFVVCALPHSVRDDADVHVSLFVTPKLVPSREGERLARSPVFSQWARFLLDARIELFDQLGDIDCEPLLAAVRPATWAQLFPPDETPVRSQSVPQWQDRTWRSFDTQAVATLAKAHHLSTVYVDPTTPPLPNAHPLMQPLATLVRQLDGRDDGGLAGTRFRRPYDESVITDALDRLVGDSSLERWSDRPGPVVSDDLDELVLRMAVELHRVRRFYERPESQAEYHERPDPDAISEPLPERQPEFHERVTAAGDVPALMRRLGLVVDLRADVDRLRQSEWIGARVQVAGNATGSSTRVRCETTPDGGFVTVAEEPAWRQGALALGDEQRFTVLDLDTDGSAIKTERFLWTLPRLLAVQVNDDPVHAAPPALRTQGFTVSRTGQALTSKRRLDRQERLDAELRRGDPMLTTEDVTRGMRVEVWDDSRRRWASLHERLVTVEDPRGGDALLEPTDDPGFVQGTTAHETPGTADSPVHVHEAMFGWEGWSLAAPRPGARVRHDDGEEKVEDPATPPGDDPRTPPHPMHVTSEAKPGSLPRLRYGRSYAFRAWQVDLAGNSRPHDLDPPAGAPLGDVAAALQPRLAQALTDPTATWSGAFRQATHRMLESRRLATPEVPDVVEPPAQLTTLLGPRLRDLRLEQRAPDSDVLRSARRRALVDEAAAAAVADPTEPLVNDTVLHDLDAVSALVASHLRADVSDGSLADQAVKALDTVTRLRPFLRWDPVQPPAVVARRRFSEGESLRVLVVRSGVTQDPETLAVTVTDPASYAVEAAALGVDYAATSERHLAAPKTSQFQAELHGRFDAGIGSTTAADQQKMLAWAISEDGTFLDRDRADLTSPGDRLPQPGVRLEVSAEVPQAEPKVFPEDPAPADPSLVLHPGDPLAPGQYVVHDVDDLTLPYLPDPVAAGVSFVFPEAGRDRKILFPFGGEGFTAAYAGSWPEKAPYRLVLEGDDTLDGEVSGRVIRLMLPPGDLQKARMSSSLAKADLSLFGPWRSLNPTMTATPEVVEAAADGWLWALTPSEDVLLVHAVPRPLEAPRPTLLVPVRAKGSTDVALWGGLDVHGPSTDLVVAEARWTDPVDDLALARWQARDSSAAAFQTHVRPEEDLLGLGSGDLVLTAPGFEGLRVHKALHQVGDTRHHQVTYRFRASTRFREYFHPDLLAPTHEGDDGRSVVSSPVVVDVPSSAPPAAPVVHSVIPLFRWDYGVEPEQPMARRHVRRAGVRIYLGRPWFSSGDGELLAVLVSPNGDDSVSPPPEDGSGYPFVSKVGADPAWISTPVGRRVMTLLPLDDLLHVAGLDDRHEPGRPVRQAELLPLPTADGRKVLAVGYRPQYNEERGLWYVDVALDPGRTVWSFLRLAVARWQPSSVPGCHLSAPVRCDFVQLPPERTLSVSRTDASHARVVLSGPVGIRDGGRSTAGNLASVLDDLVSANRLVVARLQRRDPAIDTDLGWRTVTTSRLHVRGQGHNPSEVAWVGELDAGTDLPLRRPDDPPLTGGVGGHHWRVTVEEWERFPGDVPAPGEAGGLRAALPRWEQRLVYADEVLL